MRRGRGAWSSAIAVVVLIAIGAPADAEAQQDSTESEPVLQQARAEPPAPDGPITRAARETLPEPAAERPFSPLIQPSLHVRRAAGEIELDGELNDPGWQGAARADGFSTNFPEEMGQPEVESEVLVTYDQDNLYLAFIAYDDPSTIRASLRDRDEMFSDDYFGILLDTYGDASWAVYLFANPYGVQGDTRFAVTSGEDSSFDLLYYTEGKITDEGYVIEMRVPFASLRFPDAERQEWRATFWRTRPRGSREQHTWAAIDRDNSCFLCQYGTLTGIEGVEPGGSLELLPTVVGSQSSSIENPDDPTGGLQNDGFDGEPSLGMRYSFPVGLTTDLALNPDFSQIESDAAQIDANSTFALFFPERRPLFQEGADVFSTPIDQVYTRSINDPQVVGKAIGRMDRTTLGYIGGLDETSPILIPLEERSYVGQTRKSVSNIVRAQQSFMDDSYAGVLFTDRRFIDHDGSNTSLGVDGQLRFLEKYRFEWQLVGTHSQEPNDSTLTSGVNDLTFDAGRRTVAYDGESFFGNAASATVRRNARTWNFNLSYRHFSPTFRVDNGFETRNDMRRVSMYQGLSFWPSASWIDRVGPGVFGAMAWNWAGQKKSDYVQLWLNAQLKGQTSLEPAFEIENERFGGIDFTGLTNLRLFANSNFSEPVKLGFFFAHGDRIARNLETPELGRGTDAEIFGTFTLFHRFILQPSVQYSDLYTQDDGEEVFRGFVLRTAANLQFNRELFFRVIVQWDDFGGNFSFEPLLTYRLNPFTVFYVGATSGYSDYGRRDDLDLPTEAGLVQTSRQFFLKFQYLLRL
ncbi:MAG: carbohydrate binding family 9 domain-containing protein [marine benthic group bacterium]|nr:carbohydrate binding family 9 domain-containing protein [Gemmatimonadota bacterium]